MIWPSMGCIPCKMHAYGAAPVRCTHMRDASMRWSPVRSMSMRDTPMRWPMGDIRLWERHAYDERCTPVRDTPTRGTHMRDTPIKCLFIGDILMPRRYL